MLRALAKQPQPVAYHEAVFLSRYPQLCAWARQLARGNHSEAEDLVQDAFIDFIHSRPDLSAVQNLDAFLYTILRNIHRSQLQRHLRRRNLLLSVVDYDSANLGLNAAAPFRLVEVREQLHRVCQFACERKRSSKAGSLLILRFFHGYYPAEIAAITRWDRATVDARLTLVRREARSYIESGDRLRALDLPAPPARGEAFESEAVLGELRWRIFAAVEGPCVTRAGLRKLYSTGHEGPDRAVLSHVVSCARCLEEVNCALGLDSSSDRGFGESTGPQPPNSAPNGTPPKKSSDARRQAGKWRRGALDIFEHQPRELTIVVNGSPVAWQSVAHGRNHFSIRLPGREAVEFIEIFSEQEVRLISLAVADAPPPADLELSNEVSLSDGRSLTVRLRFETLGYEIGVEYCQPAHAEAPVPFRAAPRQERAPAGWRGFPRPRFAIWAFALMAIFLFLRPGRQTAASAATLLVRVQANERAAGIQPGLVTHRSLRMEERRKGHAEVLSRRRIEVWRDGRKDARIRRLYADDGTPLATSTEANTARPVSAADVWKYEPTSDNFELLAGDPSDIAVAEQGSEVRLTATSAGLTVRKNDWHVVAGYVILNDREYRFTETGFDLVRPDATSWTETAAAAPFETPKQPAALAATAPPAIDLEDVELDCRYALHQIGADIGYPLDIRTVSVDGRPGLQLSGLVPAADRRQEIERALAAIPAVRIALKTEEEAALEALPPVRESAGIRVASERSPVEDRLRSYFGEPAAVQRFTRETLAVNDRLMSHAWAIRRLVLRYPSAGVGKLSPAARRKLDEMKAGHQRAMLAALRDLTELVEPVLKTGPGEGSAVTGAASSFPGVAFVPGGTPPGSLFDLAQQVEQWTLAAICGTGPNSPAALSRPETAIRELSDALRRLRDRLVHVM